MRGCIATEWLTNMSKAKLDVLFVSPFYYEVESFSIGVLSLATILQNSGISTKIIDLNDDFHKGNIQVGIDQCADYLLSYNPSIIGFSCMSNCYYFYIKIAERIKKTNSDITILFGGPQASMTAEKTMEMFDFVDGVYIGESEGVIVDNTQYFLRRGEENKLRNILFRKNGCIIKTESIPLITDLDTLPRLNYSLLPNFDRFDTLLIESGRGCPFSCVFCSTKTFWNRKPRLKSVTRVVSEIEEIALKYNIRRFTMVHDLFTCNRKYVVEFCKQITELRANIKWSCSARIDTVDGDLIKLMYDSGCTSIFFGVEVGSEEMQQIIHKGLKLTTIEKLLQELKKYEFDDLAFSFMYNFPDETEESIQKTVHLLLHILHDYEFDVQLGQCCLLPGTELYEKYRERLTLECIENSMTLSLPLDIGDSIIKTAPDIFTQYYIVDTPIFQKYLLLEPFMALYICLFRTFRGVLEVINHYYKEDFFKFYEEFTSSNRQWLLDTLGSIKFVESYYKEGEYSQLEAGFEMLRYLRTWFNEKFSVKEITAMDDVIRYIDILHRCGKGQLNDSITYKFGNDVVGLNKGYQFDDCVEKTTLVRIILRENGKLSVLRKFTDR